MNTFTLPTSLNGLKTIVTIYQASGDYEKTIDSTFHSTYSDDVMTSHGYIKDEVRRNAYQFEQLDDHRAKLTVQHAGSVLPGMTYEAILDFADANLGRIHGKIIDGGEGEFSGVFLLDAAE